MAGSLGCERKKKVFALLHIYIIIYNIVTRLSVSTSSYTQSQLCMHFFKAGSSRVSSLVTSLLLVPPSRPLCNCRIRPHPLLLGWNYVPQGGKERAPKAYQSLKWLVVMEMVWIAPGIWVYLGWKGTLGRTDIPHFLSTDLFSSLLVEFLCE